jgi:hypothetical protein
MGDSMHIWGRRHIEVVRAQQDVPTCVVWRRCNVYMTRMYEVVLMTQHEIVI